MTESGGLTLTDRLSRIEGELVGLRGEVTRLNTMAGRYTPEEIAAYQRWRESVDGRLAALERADAVSSEISSWKRWQIGQTVGIVTALGGVAGVFVVLIQHWH